jgi:hypothetical protein
MENEKRLADALRIDLLAAPIHSIGIMGGMKTISTTEPWSKADVFFLEDALRRGMSAQDIAGFLRRTVDEVQAKGRELDDSRRG